jgi:hypothetical protein
MTRFERQVRAQTMVLIQMIAALASAMTFLRSL